MLILMKWNVIDYFVRWDSRFYGQRIFNMNSLQLMMYDVLQMINYVHE